MKIKSEYAHMLCLSALLLMLTPSPGDGGISPDPMFDEDGLAITKIGAGRDEARAIAIQDDGKIVVAGQSGEPDSSVMAVLRYLPDGSLDREFSFNAGTLIGAGFGSDGVRALQLDPDGGLLLGGYATENGTRFGALVKLLSDGRLDYQFGDQGVVLFTEQDSDFSDIQLAPDGTIIAAGSLGSEMDVKPLIVRFDGAGTIDPTFAEDGVWRPSDVNGELYGLADRAQSGFVGGGYVLDDQGRRQFLLVRLTGEGSPEPTFGRQGLLMVGGLGEDVVVYDIDVLPDDSLVAVGEMVNDEGTSAIMIGHYDDAGRPDQGLSETGMQRYEIGEQSSAYAVGVLDSGEVLVTGYRQEQSGRDTIILRFELSSNQIATSSLPESITEQTRSGDEVLTLLQISELQLQNGFFDDSLLANEAESATGLEADLTTTELSGSDEQSQAIAPLSDGTVFTAGSSGSESDSGILVAKYLADDQTNDDGESELNHTTSSSFYTVETQPVTDITRVSAATGGWITELRFDEEACLSRCEESCGEEVEDTSSVAGEENIIEEESSTSSDPALTCTEECNQGCVVPSVVQRGVVFSIEPGALFDPDEPEDSSDDTDEDDETTDDTNDEIIDDSPDETDSESNGLDSIFNPFGRDRLFDLDNYLVIEGQTDDGEGAGQFFSDIEDVNPQTIYYVRAYALLSDGTVVYGEDKQFRTEDACFIATAAFGSIDGSAVRILRQFRDRYLSSWAGGRVAVSYYYKISPPIAEVVAQSLVLRAVVMLLVLPVAVWAWALLHLELCLFAVTMAAMMKYYLSNRRNWCTA